MQPGNTIKSEFEKREPEADSAFTPKRDGQAELPSPEDTDGEFTGEGKSAAEPVIIKKKIVERKTVVIRDTVLIEE